MLARSATGEANTVICIPHADSIHFQTITVPFVNDPGKACICIGMFLKKVKPGFYWELFNQNCKSCCM